jgi:NAD(P)H-dependent flavin oxidoreductase YrpB (nitropropane dioxygenase family)
LCDLLGIDYPVIQSGMGFVAGPDLVAEVCRAGGLGVLAGLNVPPDELRARIRQVRALTDRPFGINLWLHTELRPPADPATITDDRLAAVHGVLNRFRARLGLPAQAARPGAVPNIIDAQIEVIPARGGRGRGDDRPRGAVGARRASPPGAARLIRRDLPTPRGRCAADGHRRRTGFAHRA